MSIVILLLAIDDYYLLNFSFSHENLSSQDYSGLESYHGTYSMWRGMIWVATLSQSLFLTSWSISPNVGLFDSSPWLYIIYLCLDFNKVKNTTLHINFKLFLCSDILQNRLSNSWCLYYFKFIQLIFQGCLLQICHLFTLIVLWLSFGWESKIFARLV